MEEENVDVGKIRRYRKHPDTSGNNWTPTRDRSHCKFRLNLTLTCQPYLRAWPSRIDAAGRKGPPPTQGDAAAEITQAVAIAVKLKAIKADFDSTIALHPTAAEELVTIRTPTARYVREAAAE